jgi:hypothetical protein
MPRTVRPPTDRSAGRGPRFRAYLAATTASAAAPYGYTISLGGSIAVAGERLPGPGLLGALLLVIGAVAGFVVLEALAQRSLQPSATADDQPPSIMGNAHVPSAGGAIFSVWALLHLVTGLAGWAVTGFAATVVYFAVTAAQRIATRRWTRRSPAPAAAVDRSREDEPTEGFRAPGGTPEHRSRRPGAASPADGRGDGERGADR